MANRSPIIARKSNYITNSSYFTLSLIIVVIGVSSFVISAKISESWIHYEKDILLETDCSFIISYGNRVFEM